MQADERGRADPDDPAPRQLAVTGALDDRPGLEPDQQEDGVLEDERDRAPVQPLGDPRLGGLQDRRLVAQQQAGDDDRDHARGVHLLGDDVRRERDHQRQRAVEHRVGRGGGAAWRRRGRSTKPTRHAAAGRDAGSRGRPRPTSKPLPSATASAVPSATSAVASLSSDSPSRIVTIRRGSPIRRPIAVAATASGARPRHRSRGDRPTRRRAAAGARPSPTPKRRERDQPDRQQQDRPPVGALKSTSDVPCAAEYKQRRQQPEQHDVLGELDLRAPSGRTTPTTPTRISRNGAGTSSRSATQVHASTPTARPQSSRVISTADILPTAAADT